MDTLIGLSGKRGNRNRHVITIHGYTNYHTVLNVLGQNLL